MFRTSLPGLVVLDFKLLAGQGGVGVHDLDRIIEALAAKDLDGREFERCAVSFLSTVYEGLTAVPGGSDWGRDADIQLSDRTTPIRVIITSSRTPKGVRDNLVRSLTSMAQHGVPVERIVLVNRIALTQLQRVKLHTKASERNIVVEAHYGQDFFANRLRTDGEWRERLLGLSSHPITLSRLPAEIAESQWVHLPLTGREQEAEQLEFLLADGDVIVTGHPGVGKSRLVSALDEVMFVDHDADLAALAKDIRWLQPRRLAVDDAGQHLDLVRRLTTLRRAESDLLTYSVVAICWPDEVDAVRDRLRSAEQLDVEALERPAVDAIVQAMGVGNILARSQILDQAEGRPGWAVALADMLLKTRKWESIFDGAVILGQAVRYLRRVGISSESIGMLTALAALRFVTDDQVARLAKSIDIPVSKLRLMLFSVARSGIVDVGHGVTSAGPQRTYTVRPPMLADVLVPNTRSVLTCRRCGWKIFARSGRTGRSSSQMGRSGPRSWVLRTRSPWRPNFCCPSWTLVRRPSRCGVTWCGSTPTSGRRPAGSLSSGWRTSSRPCTPMKTSTR